MPYTLNGVGTRYYGKKNLETFTAQCEFCNKVAPLQNYETTLCFCVLFIPVIPLGRKQVLNACPRCRRLRVTSAAKWHEIKTNTIDAGLSKLAEQPNDPDSVCRLLNSYLAFRQFDQAADLAGVAQRQFPNHAGVQIQTAGCFETLERKPEAEAAWKRALTLEPQNLTAKRGLILRQIDAKAFPQARTLLKSPPEIAASANPGLYLALARGFQAEGSHREALDLFTEVLAAVPRYATDKAFRAWVQTSERTLGVERSLLPVIPFWRRGGVRLAAAAAALFLLPLVISWYLSAHRTLQVVNGFDQPVTFHVDDNAEATVAPRGRQTVTLSEGSHHATYKIGNLPPQQVDFTIADGFFARFGNARVPILNPGGGTVLVWEQAEYSERPNANPQPYKFLVGDEFLSADPTDYLFEPFPATIQLNSGQTVTKSRLFRVDIPPANVLGAFSNVSVDSQMKFAESHLRAAPDDQNLLLAYIGFAAGSQQTARCRDFLVTGLDARPVQIEWHRGYQSLQTSEADTEKLRDQYSAMLAKEPKNSALLYLRGRLEVDSDRALDYFQRAIDADPKNAYPYFAKSYQLLSAGDFAAAKPPIAEAIRLEPNHLQMREQWFLVRFAAGDYQELAQELRKAQAAEPLLLDVQIQLLEVLAAENLLPEAEKVQAGYETRLRAVGANQQAAEAAQRSGLTLLYLEKKFSEMLARTSGAGTKPETSSIRFSANLELGKLDDAGALLETADADLAGEGALCLSIAWRARTDDRLAAKTAAQWQAKARKAFYAGSNETRAMARMLDALPKVDMAEAKRLSISPTSKAVLLLALAQQCPEHRAELLAYAKKMNFLRDRPYFFIQRTIAAAESAQ